MNAPIDITAHFSMDVYLETCAFVPPPLSLSVTTPVLAILLPTDTIFDTEDRGQRSEFSRNPLKALLLSCTTMLPVSKIPIYEPDVDASFDLTFDPRFYLHF